MSAGTGPSAATEGARVRMLHYGRHHCVACDVLWTGATPCWVCGWALGETVREIVVVGG